MSAGPGGRGGGGLRPGDQAALFLWGPPPASGLRPGALEKRGPGVGASGARGVWSRWAVVAGASSGSWAGVSGARWGPQGCPQNPAPSVGFGKQEPEGTVREAEPRGSRLAGQDHPRRPGRSPRAPGPLRALRKAGGLCSPTPAGAQPPPGRTRQPRARAAPSPGGLTGDPVPAARGQGSAACLRRAGRCINKRLPAGWRRQLPPRRERSGPACT